MNDLGFDPSDSDYQGYDPSTTDSLPLLPNGVYVATCTHAEVDARPNYQGEPIKKLKLRWRIQGGAHDGRNVFDDTIVWHSNQDKQKAVFIGRKKIASLQDVRGKKIGNSTDIVGTRVAIIVVTKDERTVGGTTYKARNEVKGYRDPASAPVPTAKPTAPAAAPAAPAPVMSKDEVPW